MPVAVTFRTDEDPRGIEAKVGLLSLNLRQPRLRFEDIRGVEPSQTIVERVLGIGDILVGSAMSDEVEIVMTGVPSPREVQNFLTNEIEKRIQSLGGISRAANVSVITAD